MVRPHAINVHPPSLFRVIKVPVARHHQEGSSKPNPTILKTIGGYHRRVVTNSDERKKRTFVSFFKNTIRKIKDVLRMPSNPLIRRIQELEDDIKLLRHKNEILEKGYTFGTGADDSSERSSTNAQSNPDRIRSEESEATATTAGQKTIVAPETEVPEECHSNPIEDQHLDTELPVPIPPPAPPIIPSSANVSIVPLSRPAPPVAQQQSAAIPAPPPAPPLPSVRSHTRPPVAVEPVALSKTASTSEDEQSGGISLHDILNIKLKPVNRKDAQDSAFRITSKELFSVPLKPVSRRGRPPARKDPESDNEDFRILRAAMKRRIEALYSPSVSAAASDADWSVSPLCRTKQARQNTIIQS